MQLAELDIFNLSVKLGLGSRDRHRPAAVFNQFFTDSGRILGRQESRSFPTERSK